VSPAGAHFVWAELPWREVQAQLARMAQAPSGPTATGFLDTHQWCYLRDDPQLVCAGGHPQAQFRRVGIGHAPPVRHFRVERSALPEGVRTARQLRSWLYRAGLPDSAVGDIALGEYAVLVVEEDVELAELGLAARLAPDWQPALAPPARVTAAGARADAVVAALFKVSRGEAQTAIKYGFVFCDFHEVEKQTHNVPAGAQLVYRTKGRADILALDQNTKSGRLWVEFRLYPA
jgi:hypothetical protein